MALRCPGVLSALAAREPATAMTTPPNPNPFAPELPKDFMAFRQQMWNPMSFPVPGMFMPTANVEDIEKKIAELKGVETWLTMNIGFIQMTVKTLEMQKAALASFSAAAAGAKPENK
jgi:hypothetical protein